MELRVLALYPEQMNIYADRGNIIFLRRRCEWRGIDFSYAAAGPGEGLDPDAHDLIYIGGGQDRDQRLVAADLVATKRDALASAVEDGAVVLAVCGGYQLLGHSYQLGDERIEGLGLADLETVREPGARLIGNVAIEADLGRGRRDRRRLREPRRAHLPRRRRAQPLGKVVKGLGNNGKDGFEGVRRPEHDRHLPPRPASAQERAAGGPPDRARARPPRGRGAAAGAARRRLRARRPTGPPTRRRCAASARWSRSRPRRGPTRQLGRPRPARPRRTE